MLRWCSRHPIWFMAGYLMLYLAVFRWQELHLTPVVWVHTPLDDLIPFCEYAILPYLAWFVWIPFTLFALLRGPRTDFMRLCLPLFAGMTAAPSWCAGCTPPTPPPTYVLPSMYSTL